MSSAATAAALYAAAVSPAQLTGAVPEDAKERRHHLKGKKGFQNPWDSFRDQNGWNIGRAMIWRHLTGKSNKPDTSPPTVPVHAPTFLPSRSTQSLRATWLGHACYLVEFPSGFRVLFDPVFTHRCSPFSWMGPARYTKAPCQIDDIPMVDAVVISHNHYDHLSHPTIMRIKEKHPEVHFFVPLGNKRWFEEACGITNVTELDWWESRDIRLSLSQAKTGPKSGRDIIVENGSDSESTARSDSGEDIVATIGCLPCQHMTARTPFDRMHTLWASWSVESGGKKVWFAGDTGYRSVPESSDGEDDYGEKYKSLPHCPAFAQIGDLRGPFDLGLIPIGAYDPRFIMSPMHANPKDAVNIFVDSKCRRALGMHWGTWVLTEEDVLEPPKLLRQALAEKDILEWGIFDVCDIGESREFADTMDKL
ncbi:Metallo-hydrolase/oxidoreductase [Rhizodiscina lignyota]|uniref:Metallo-hydrolase/oxidoreductase n=1 Tax=Rhizodiscina lignyota TaxID=1504668 RepID=A0A9P4M885_9PEZI|nr:Metallo-hydrolase/oxidoreductase [Rhizodiscina lignyota]